MSKFIHLRCHTNYSICEGCLNIKHIIDLCKRQNIPAVAMTDTNNMFGIYEFSSKLVDSGIQPIIGLQIDAYINHQNKDITGKLVLLAKSELGYKNLLKIHENAYKYKFENKLDTLVVDLSLILKYSTDIICLTGGTDGLLSACIDNNIDKEIIVKLQQYYKSDLYIELNRFFYKVEEDLEKKFLSLAKDYNIPIVATNNVTFAERNDHEMADILLCISQGVTQKEKNRKYSILEAYFKSEEEMINLFQDLPEAIENTIKIAKKCCFFLEKQQLSLPSFDEDEKNLIVQEANKGLQNRLQKEVFERQSINEKSSSLEIIKEEYQSRLNFELDIIISMGFSGYFLIVSDFINWAKNNDIPVGVGRGSGAGSLVAWCLNITDVDPILFGLLFERFLNPSRISMPDFDIDFCQEGRDYVIDYVRQKYGANRVSHIISFGTFQPKAAIKDVGRVLGLPYSEVDNITKIIPHSAPSNPITMTKILNEELIKKEINNKDHIKHLFNISSKIEGLFRNISTHAAGIIISKYPLNEVAPIFYDNESHIPSIGISIKHIEDMGLVKFDFLALKTLTVINNTLKLVKSQTNNQIDMYNLPYQDTNIQALLGAGETLGIFQLESRGVTEVIKQLNPDHIHDIIAIISLYRPGPLENIPLYISNKNNSNNIKYLHEKVEFILKETFGIMIYQEQVMQVAQVISGYSLGDADILRRSMGKKDPIEMKKQREIFVKGSQKNSPEINTELAGDIFDQIEKFAGYGFNKSHAVCYGLISWQTAYLKAYYKTEFLAASISSEINNNNKDQQKFIEYVEEAKKNNIDILPPSINHPSLKFEIEIDSNNKKSIRYSLLSIKGVGRNLIIYLMSEIKENGPFKSIEDFFLRADYKFLNKKAIESMIKAGCFDNFNSNRYELIKNVEYLISFNYNVGKNKDSEQIDLFDTITDTDKESINIIPYEKWTSQEQRNSELEVLGYFISGHPLFDYTDIIEKQNVVNYVDLIYYNYSTAYLAGYLMKVKVSKSKSGTLFANLSFYDKSSLFNLVLFNDKYNLYKEMLSVGSNYIIKITTRNEDNDFKVFVDKIYELNSEYKIKKHTNRLITPGINDNKTNISLENHLVEKNQEVVMSIEITSLKPLEDIYNIIGTETGVDKIELKILNHTDYLIFEIPNIKNILYKVKELYNKEGVFKITKKS